MVENAMKIGIIYREGKYVNDFILNEDSYKICEVIENGEAYVSNISFRDNECIFIVTDSDQNNRVKLEKDYSDHEIELDDTKVEVLFDISRNEYCKVTSYSELKTQSTTEIFTKN